MGGFLLLLHYVHYAGTTVFAASQLTLEYFAGVKLYCLHALAVGN